MLHDLRKVNRLITVVCFAGVLVSIYALRVEIKKEDNDDYEALCDISERMSCSHVLTSRWSRGFGIIGAIFGEDSSLNQPNSLVGIFVYALLAVINMRETIKAAKLLFTFGILANILSVYLASILYFVLEDLCIVCVTTYVINALLLVLSWHKKQLVARSQKVKLK